MTDYSPLEGLRAARNVNKAENARRVARKEVRHRGQRKLGAVGANRFISLVPNDVVINTERQRDPNQTDGWNFANSLDVQYTEAKRGQKMPLAQWSAQFPENNHG